MTVKSITEYGKNQIAIAYKKGAASRGYLAAAYKTSVRTIQRVLVEMKVLPLPKPRSTETDLAFMVVLSSYSITPHQLYQLLEVHKEPKIAAEMYLAQCSFGEAIKVTFKRMFGLAKKTPHSYID